MGALAHRVFPSRVAVRDADAPCDNTASLVAPNAVLSEVHQSQKSGVQGNGKAVFNDQESEARDGYGP
ncbi:hypothetical protein HPP92_022869 [Vanilla planifolia]|uniref:Uncharacterized protein n=1 Tax=Vanilla planifolia TaxID=51239 RepID=A0A835PUD1_VANPL|nr:hypothetical protein HPP92_022869 [Vanilla planifolia]